MKLLLFLNLLDQSNNLSITNLMMYLVLIRLFCSQNDLANIIFLFIACLNYIHKRYINAKSSQTQIDVQSKINEAIESNNKEFSELSSKVNGLVIKMGMGK